MGKVIKKDLFKQQNEVKKIDLVHIYITRNCNLQCRHCYTNAGETNNAILPYSFWEKAFEQLINLKVRCIHLEGGEALLYPDIEKIVKLLSSYKIREFLLVSNGLLATKEKLASLKQNGLKKIAISLDSIHENVHDELRPGSQKFALSSIKNAVELGFHTRVSSVLNRKNIGLVKEFIDAVYNMGVKTLNLDWFNMAGRGRMCYNEFGITENHDSLLNDFQNDIYDISVNSKYTDFNLSIDLPEWFIKRDTFMAKDLKRTHYIDCDAVKRQISINEEGNVYPCFIFSEGDGVLGNLNDSTLVEILNSSNFNCKDCPIGVTGHMFYQIIF